MNKSEFNSIVLMLEEIKESIKTIESEINNLRSEQKQENLQSPISPVAKKILLEIRDALISFYDNFQEIKDNQAIQQKMLKTCKEEIEINKKSVRNKNRKIYTIVLFIGLLFSLLVNSYLQYRTINRLERTIELIQMNKQ